MSTAHTGSMRNIDPSELAKFERLASRWWDADGEFRPLHQINPLRLDYIDRLVSLNGKSVLDVGCGGGILSESMWERGATVTGIDAGHGPISVATLHARERAAKIDYREGTAEELAEDGPGRFDVITCMELLEHVPEPSQTIAACASMLRIGGSAFFSTINRNPKSFLFAIVGAEYVLNILPRGTHRYAKFIRPSEMEAWCRKAGLITAGIIGLHYNPLTAVYRLGRGVEVNYIMHFQRIQEGVASNT